MATIAGTTGDDTLTGTIGPDSIEGLAGNDSLIGDDGNDTLRGGDGEDTLNGGPGDDLLDGGTNLTGRLFDRAAYGAATGPVTVNLATGVASGAGIGTDTLVGIEGVHGSSFDDTLIGASTPDYFMGGPGNDYINGGEGFDLVSHFSATSAINLNFVTGTVVGTSTGTDTLVSIEGAFGTSFDDTLIGSATGEFFRGNAGNDTIDGGGGVDTAAYDLGPTGSTSISANLLTGVATGTGFGTDTLIRIENLVGTYFDDTLIGDDNGNAISAQSGNDQVQGNGGNDSLLGEAGNDTLLGGDGSDTLDGGADDDSVEGQAGNDTLIGSTGNDTLRGGDGEDTLSGGAGDDLLDGGINTLGTTFDRVDYAAATGPVNVNLATGVASGAGIGTDTLVGIEGVQGSSFDDTMIGASTPDYFHGGAGNDYIEGGDGFDLITHFAATSGINLNFTTGTVVGTSTGTDTLVSIEGVLGTNFDDSLVGSDASEFFRGNAGNDTIDGGAGIDMAAYDSGPTGSTSINANLLTGVATGAGFGTDTLIRIENLRGGNFDDTLIGDNNGNSISGRGGNDLIQGNGGDDSLLGEAGNDSLSGGGGTDTLDGGAGDDVLDGGGQVVMSTTADGFQSAFLTADVSNSYDCATYSSSASPVTVILGPDGTAGSATGASIGTDTLIDIEHVFGGSGNDFIRGSNRAVNEILSGGPGDDTLYGGAEGGVDQGSNLLDYRSTTATGPSGVNVNLQTGMASGAAGNDVFSGFIGVLGSPYDDTIVGAATNDFLEGGGGNDSIDGGDGFDMASYWLPTSLGFVGGVTVDLSLGQASGAQGTDQLLRIEGVRGSGSADILRGNAEPNLLQGRGGDDLLEGGAGADTLMGGTGSDTLDGGAGRDVAAFLITRANADVIRTTAGVTVSDKTGNLGSDVLVNIERVHFTDTKLALDLAPNQAAAQVALLIGVLLPVGIAQPSITGALMPLADAGFDASGMAQTLVDIGIVAALAGSNQPTDIARMAARNVLKIEPAPDLVATLAGFMNGALATLTPAQFIGIIANLELNQEAIGLVGLQQSGLAFA